MDKATNAPRAGRPKGWSPKTGWAKVGLRDQAAERRKLALEAFEAHCCAQVERIERVLANRYGFDYDGRSDTSVGATVPSNRYHVMPQNDAMSRKAIYADCVQEVRR